MDDAHRTTDDTITFTHALAEAGYDDVLVLGFDTAREVLTPKRRDLLAHLRDNDVTSIRDLARALDRNVSTVHDDVRTLYEHAVIDLDEDGARKRPMLRHETIAIKPIALAGDTVVTSLDEVSDDG